MSDQTTFDIAVIGGGIAGASVAYELAADADVVLLEMEPQPGFHSTGRSAAAFAPSYGPAPIRALTRASEAFYRDPPDGIADHPLLTPRGALFVATTDQMDRLAETETELAAEARLQRLDAPQTCALQPLLRADYVAGGLLDPDCSDIDVSALHQGYLRLFRQRGGRLATRAEVTALSRDRDHWTLDTPAGQFRAPVVVNAAGAWAGHVGHLAGAEDIGLIPKRRTVLTIAAPDDGFRADAPLVVDVDEAFYLKPDAGRLLISPANEDPDQPSDVQPDEMDIALCIDRIERAFSLNIRRIENRWAGLRSFVPDKSPVAGFSDRVEGFFWLAGQGGYGIQSAPALASFAAAMVTGRPVPPQLLAQDVDPATLAVARLR